MYHGQRERARHVDSKKRFAMNISRYEPTLAPQLTEAYNQAIRGVPHCYPASVQDFAAAVAPAVGRKGHELLRSEAAFVALQGTSVLGFVHAAIRTDWHNYRAALFYTNLGYRVVDWTYAFGVELKQSRTRDLILVEKR